MKNQRAVVTLLTDGAKGHTLNRRQVLSPDRSWCVYDTRNHDPDIGITQTIERLHIASGSTELLYSTGTNDSAGTHLSVGTSDLGKDFSRKATPYGPGVGAAAYHPSAEKVVFIHGLWNCCKDNPYSIRRRFGALLDIQSKTLRPLETRQMHAPVLFGTLSGGTHAHSWSPSGRRVSFTYDDALETSSNRTIGWGDCLDLSGDQTVELSNHRDCVDEFDPSNIHSSNCVGDFWGEEFVGASPCYLVLHTSLGRPIEQAVEECWVGEDRLAFLGKVYCPRSQTSRFEIFLAKLPNKNAVPARSQLIGTEPSEVSRKSKGTPSTEGFCDIRQLTDMERYPVPGVSGPRHWLSSDPRGDWIYSLLTDSDGIVQLFRVESHSGNFEQLTHLSSSVEGQPSISPDGTKVSFVSDSKIHWWNSEDRSVSYAHETEFRDVHGRIVEPNSFDASYYGAAHFIDEQNWLINRYQRTGSESYLQICKVSLV